MSMSYYEVIFMSNYIKCSHDNCGRPTVTTKCRNYVFDTEAEMQEFVDYLNADPDYADPDLMDIIEWSFFYKKTHDEW
jgi:hypothetical protein